MKSICRRGLGFGTIEIEVLWMLTPHFPSTYFIAFPTTNNGFDSAIVEVGLDAIQSTEVQGGC